MGISVEQVLAEMAQKSVGDTFNKTVPTPLTNYLDVGPVLTPLGVREVARVLCFTLYLGFLLNRLSILGKSASALLPRCSTWCLTQAQQICGCPHKGALPFQPPAVSVPSSAPFSIQTFRWTKSWVYLESRYQSVTAEINSSLSEKLSHMFGFFWFLSCKFNNSSTAVRFDPSWEWSLSIRIFFYLLCRNRRLIWSQCETVRQRVHTEIL